MILPVCVILLMYELIFGTSLWWALFGVLLFYPLHQLGFGIGTHKLLSHNAFEPKAWYPYVSAVIASVCFFGDPMQNVLVHRLHHRYADTEKDPHSPTKGRWHAFAGWILRYEPPANSIILLRDIRERYPLLVTYRKIEWLIPILFHSLTFIINYELFLAFLLAAVLSILNGFFINAFSHNTKGEPTDSPWLARLVNPLFMHKYHHEKQKLHDYSTNDVKDFSAFVIEHFLKK